MAYEIRDNSGSIFKNDKKETESHPNGQGKCLVGGVEYYVSAWTKEGAKGKWQSLAFKPVELKKPAAKMSTPDNFVADDIPF